MNISKSRQSLKDFKIQIAANEEIQITVNGVYFKYESGSGDIILKTEEGSSFTLNVGSSVNIGEFENVKVTNKGTTTDLKHFIIGYGKIATNSVAGTVNVDTVENAVPVGTVAQVTLIKKIESKRNKILDENHFSGFGTGGGTAGQYSHTVLHNPLLSGKNIHVYKADCCLNNRSVLKALLFSTALSGFVLSTNSQNMYSGKAEGEGEIWSDTKATALTGKYIYNHNILDDTLNDVFKNSPGVVLPPGHSLVVIGGIDDSLDVSFSWSEHTI